ncbi:DMT family transporter [Methanospirillum lacunae]|uniref:EamA family transporter n=1 Tax=Methanospirillum lacunae TaxID=668570 RepID=A0A2V2N6W8_9EURY|nr:DMT family transporter [Methanospirillum lacunae]PWR74245.1 EamA family transporter [Methanospirillum lacunae]
MNQKSADIILIFIVLIWGSTYLAMKWGMESFGIFTLIALRFSIAFGIGIFILLKCRSSIYLHTLASSALLGFGYFCGFTLLLYGMKTTTTTSAGFLMATTVVFVPLLQILFFRRIPNTFILLAVCLCLSGVGLMTLKNGLALDFGAILCLFCSICYAIVIITTKWVLNSGENALTIGVLQLGFTSLFSLGAMLIFEMPFPQAPLESWGIILYLAIFCTLIGFVLQTIAQEFTSPEHTGLIYTLESVFASLFGYVFLQEVLPVQGYIGVILVFSGVIIAVKYGKTIEKTGGE